MKGVPINEIIEFLKNSVFYKPFVYNLERNGYSLEFYLENKSHHVGIINDAFSWGNTIEGHEYWTVIDRLYREWYNKRLNELNPNLQSSVDEYLDWISMAKKKYGVNIEPHPIDPLAVNEIFANDEQPVGNNVEAIPN